MKENHKFILTKYLSIISTKAKILDYGCGKGALVEEGIRQGLDIYGVEAFSYGGGVKIKEYLQERGILGNKIKELEGDFIPFPDHHFDFIVSNQVFEHVKDLDKCLSEINRVLKDNGQLLCLFASKDVIREGHCGILFAHRIPRSTFRFYWLVFFRSLGFGRLKKRRSVREWAAFFNEWLVDSVSYRSMNEINKTFNQHFVSRIHIEDDYVTYRLEKKNNRWLAYLSKAHSIRFFTRAFCRKWGGLVFISYKNKKL
ncbi:MAG: class I SAM-dependent methyltransferase [Desulfobacteraceae bacterium]|nr:MAG: class I SAM-dependent methyltransferase [Desulfobacteraceae bacterium]